jgi:hypothetical protein
MQDRDAADFRDGASQCCLKIVNNKDAPNIKTNGKFVPL